MLILFVLDPNLLTGHTPFLYARESLKAWHAYNCLSQRKTLIPCKTGREMSLSMYLVQANDLLHSGPVCAVQVGYFIEG